VAAGADAALRALLNALPASVAILDGMGRIVSVNESWRQAGTGSGAASAFFGNLGDSFLTAGVRADGRATIQLQILGAGASRVLGGSETRFTHEFVCDHPTPGRWYRVIVSPLDGPGRGAVMMYLDITDRREAEDRLRDQAALLDRSQDAITVTDLEDSIVFWSKGAERAFGWKPAETLGRRAREFLQADPIRAAEVRKSVLEKGEWTGELRQRTQDGRELTMETRASLVCAENGRARSILSIGTDVTERKKIEAQLLRAQRLESIGTLASGIAHDLNNVLAPILMSIDLLADEQLVEPHRSRILDGLRRSAQRGSTMVRQVLSFARGMEGPQVTVQPLALIEELAGIIRETFPKAIQLVVERTDMSWTICGDPTQLHQALLNLCVNARDAMPKGGELTLRIEGKVLDEGYAAVNPGACSGPHVVISVSDTGTGIPPDLREKIFDPFFTTKEIGKGTGLGLSTVLAIVKNHHGFIHLESEMNRGSTFQIHLPAGNTKAEDTDHAASASGLPVPSGSGELILLVDDEEVILDVSRKTLEKRGYRVLTAQEGATAVALYAQHQGEIAAVLTDMMMPVMDGLSTLRALRRINPDVKVIAASGLSSNVNPAKVSDAGIRYFLNKPFRTETLLKTLREAIDSPDRPATSAN
jgi:PAS domain S-box-containing protein